MACHFGSSRGDAQSGFIDEESGKEELPNLSTELLASGCDVQQKTTRRYLVSGYRKQRKTFRADFVHLFIHIPFKV